MCAHVCLGMCVQIRDNFLESVLSFYHVTGIELKSAGLASGTFPH